MRGGRRLPTRPQPTSLRRCRAPTSRSTCSFSATTVIRCSSRCGPDERRKDGRRSSGGWRASGPSHAKPPARAPSARRSTSSRWLSTSRRFADLARLASSRSSFGPGRPARHPRGWSSPSTTSREAVIGISASFAAISDLSGPTTSCSIPRGRTPITRITSASIWGVSIGEPGKSKNSRTTFSPEWAGMEWAWSLRDSFVRATPAAARTTWPLTPTGTWCSAWGAAPSDSIQRREHLRRGRLAATCSGSIQRARCGTSTRVCTHST